MVNKAESSLLTTTLKHLTGPVKALKRTILIEENTRGSLQTAKSYT